MRHPLDVNFHATKEMEKLKDTRVAVKDIGFANAVQGIQEAIQRAQSANQKGRAASSEDFDIFKEAFNLQLGTTPAMNHALLEKRENFFMHCAIMSFTHVTMTFTPMPKECSMISRLRR